MWLENSSSSLVTTSFLQAAEAGRDLGVPALLLVSRANGYRGTLSKNDQNGAISRGKCFVFHKVESTVFPDFVNQ